MKAQPVVDEGELKVERGGAPRLEVLEGEGAQVDNAAGRETAGPGTLPLEQPAPPPPPTWKPHEAATLGVAAHNIAGVFLFFGRWDDFELWRADEAELSKTSAASARLLDRLGPPGVGPLGFIADALIAGSGLVELTAKKASAVRDAHVSARAAAAQPDIPDEKTAPATAQKKTKASGSPAAPASSTPPAAAAAGGYRYPPELQAMLGQPELDNDREPAHDN